MISGMDSLMSQIRAQIREYNENEDANVTEELVFNSVLYDGLDEDLAKNVLFRKNVEQIYISRSCLQRLFKNCHELERIDLSDDKYNEFKDYYNEFLQRRSSKFTTLKHQANDLLSKLRTDMFSSEIITLVNNVKYKMSKEN